MTTTVGAAIHPPAPRRQAGACGGSRLIRLAALGLAVLVLAAPARGQEEYILSDEDRWQRSDEVDPGSPEGQLARIRKALAAKQWERAENLSTQWIERYPRHPGIADAYLYRGDSQRGRGNYYEALFDYEHLARSYPQSEAYVTALERELEIAKLFSDGLKRRFWGMRVLDASDEAEELLIRIQERMPGSSLAEEAGMELGDFYFKRREMTLAAEAYTLFLENYPRSTDISKARRRLIYAYLASFKGPEFDATGLYEARLRLIQLKASEPTTAQQIGADALLTRIADSDARKMLVTAQWYLKVGNVISAEFTIRRLVRKYPNTAATRDALRLMPEIWPRLPESVQEEAPDYDAYRAALLTSPAGEGETGLRPADLERIEPDAP